MEGKASRHHRRRSRLVLAAVLLSGVPAGCSDGEPDTVDGFLLGACVRPTADVGAGSPVLMEYRLDGELVATGKTEVGAVFIAEVPTGEVSAYADGDFLGSGRSDGPSIAGEDGRPVGGIYLGGEGCPESPF